MKEPTANARASPELVPDYLLYYVRRVNRNTIHRLTQNARSVSTILNKVFEASKVVTMVKIKTWLCTCDRSQELF